MKVRSRVMCRAVEVKVNQTKVQKKKLLAMQLMLRMTAKPSLSAAAAKKMSRSSSGIGGEVGQLLLLLLGRVDRQL
jgi:hypothetical protein